MVTSIHSFSPKCPFGLHQKCTFHHSNGFPPKQHSLILLIKMQIQHSTSWRSLMMISCTNKNTMKMIYSLNWQHVSVECKLRIYLICNKITFSELLAPVGCQETMSTSAYRILKRKNLCDHHLFFNDLIVMIPLYQHITSFIPSFGQK